MNLIVDYEIYDDIDYNILNETTHNITEFVEKVVAKVNKEKFDSLLFIRYIISCISFILIIIGIITNLISSLAFSNKKYLSSTNIYLTSLCLADCVALIGLLINSVIYGIFVYIKYYTGVKLIVLFYPYVYQIILTSQFASIYLTMSVSINQYIFIAFSKGFHMKNNKLSKQKDIKNSYTIVAVIVIISILFCLPYWFTFKYTENNGLERSQISQNNYFNKIVHLFLYIPFACLIPFSVLITTNTYLLIKLVKANHRKETIKSNCQLITFANTSSTSHFYKNDKIEVKNKSTMLIAIVFFFLICQFPTLILHLIETETFGQNYKEHLFYFYLVELSKLLLIINLSFNFAFFYLFSQKFRSNLRNVLCFKKTNLSSDIIVI
jgi:hypothetical protein